MKGKEESEKVGLKLNIQKTKIMESCPITWWQIDGEMMETVRNFILGGSKINADGDCSHEIKRCLLLGRKARTNLDSLLKSRDITLPTKVCLVQLCDPMDGSPPGSSVRGSSRQEYWSRLLCPLPGYLPNPGIEPTSLMSTCTGRQVLYH